ncbi:MAG: hypothetical protein JRG73_07105 [Deltaproteobacteria bacterium]|nr:hypothetical protein [Deltaproteobacteria bacterium]MBW2306693.1 hypothetical protein [Deltaproteobacteria bacterium]
MSGKWESHFDPRTVLGEKILEIGMSRPECIVMSADLMSSCRLLGFADACPARCVNVGVAEQNMVGIAAGLAIEGKVPWISSIAPFATMRCCEQIRTDLCYNYLHVVVVSIMAGLSGAPLGATHYATEDIGIFRSFANMTILNPADQWEIERAMEAAMDAQGPVYLRLGSGMEPNLPVERRDFSIGRAYTLKEGSDASIISTGYMVHKALQAAEVLEEKGVSTGVYDHPTLKPLDGDSVLEAANNRKVVVTLEEHNVFGGLGSAVAEVMAGAGCTAQLKRMGIPDIYAGVGEREALLSKYGLDVPSVVRCVEDSLGIGKQ